MKRSTILSVTSILLLYIVVSSCSSNSAAQEMPDELEERYKNKGVKEVFIELEQFYQGKLYVAKHLEKHLTLDKEGRTIRWERSEGKMPVIFYRMDNQYSKEGLPDYTSYVRKGAYSEEVALDPNTPLAEIEWIPTQRYRYPSENKKGGTDNWNAEKNKWETVEVDRLFTKRDTTYKITKNADNITEEVERNYQLKSDKSVYRTDYLTYSERKGLREPKYYYRKTENGRITESGSIDFEEDLHRHLEKNPADRMRIFGAQSNFYNLLDQVARQYPGTLKPTRTLKYNAAGQLIEETSYDNRTTYTRDKTGRLLSEKEFFSSGGARTITYTYNEKGLVEKAVTTEPDGNISTVQYFSYRYF